MRAIVLLVLLLLPFPANAQKRVALVLGNAAYQHAPQLANPKNDAIDIAAALHKHGFQVLKGLDLDKAGMERAIRDFAGALAAAPDVGVFFYAGHGLQVSGQNYLVPIDAQLTGASALDFELVRLDFVHRIMEREARTNILFIDACRNNPLARNLARAMGTRSAEVGRGLAPIEAGAGTLISFSTQPGNVALDGTGRNSPFAGALIRYASSSKDDLGAILIDVRNEVMNATKNQQVPWEHSALRGRFYFHVHAGPRLSEAERAWQTAKDMASGPALEAFIRRFGDTYYGDLAKMRLAELSQAAAAKKKGELRQKVQFLAEKHRLPVPEFEIELPASDVPAPLQRFVGVWVHDDGSAVQGRDQLLIVTRVEKEGSAFGHYVFGPPGPKSFFQLPAGSHKIAGRIEGDTLSFSCCGGTETYKYTPIDGNRMRFHYSNAKGQSTSHIFYPVWSPLESGRAARR